MRLFAASLYASVPAFAMVAALSQPAIGQPALEDQIADALEWMAAEGHLTYEVLDVDSASGIVRVEGLHFAGPDDARLSVDAFEVTGLVYEEPWLVGLDQIELSGLRMENEDGGAVVDALNFRQPGFNWRPLLPLFEDERVADEGRLIFEYLAGLDIDEFALSGFQFADDESELSLERFGIRDLQSGWSGELDRSSPGMWGMDAFFEAVQDYALSLELGSWTFEGLAAASDGSDVWVGRSIFENVSEGVIGRLALEDFIVTGNDEAVNGSVVLGLFEFAGLDMDHILEFARTDGERPGVLVQPFERLSIREFGVSMEEAKVTLGFMEMNQPEQMADGAFSQRSGFRDLRVALGSEALADPITRRLGLEEFEISVEFAYHYDPGDERMDIEGSFDSGELGALTFGYRLSGLPESVMIGPMGQGEEMLALLSAVYEGGSMRYEERGFLVRLLEVVAESGGVTLEMLLASLVAELNSAPESGGPDFRPFAADIEAFLRSGGALVITARPPQPIPLMTLPDLEDPVATLNLTIEREF